ncbi:hypothetical protein M413DRAFT_78494 [Hebeloma cylindrosporum]|uniref:Malic enzyme n=1 Tax=Hebeloma cylindrosporum TaxID=76867 RepID=A0A0C3BVX7_HEBCY|nr:hypothetical protein M413DRAFT_78494 [Hebeloma cylindrosporum h7]
MDFHAHKPTENVPPQGISLRGKSLLESPRFNKGTAFTRSERNRFGLEGRLPYRVHSLDEQCARAWEQVQTRTTDLAKNTFLQSLKEQNWVLYYALLSRHLRALVPIIYTPTEAEAIADYSHICRRSEGLFLALPNEAKMEELFLEETRGRDIDLFVVTDAEATLGIGDQGVGISTAKSVIYSLIGGLDPSKTVSAILDVGTNNDCLLNDPLYLGLRERRVRGDMYDRFVDKFVQLVRKHFPHSLLHFEDFGTANAHRLLDQYRHTHAVFNDDIQGTGAVTLACVLAATRISSRPTKLSDQRFVIFGAGAGGMGITTQLRDAMMTTDRISRDEANRSFWLIDKEGLLFEESGVDKEDSDMSRREFYRPKEERWTKDGSGTVGLLDVVCAVRPTALIGASTRAGAFTEEVVRAMVDGLEPDQRPIILPLSNPSRLIEAKPQDILKWTNGMALVATGSPFGTVKVNVGGESEREVTIAECNNALIYPGLGFGAILSCSRRVTDTMLIAGANRLADLSPLLASEAEDVDGKVSGLLPDIDIAAGINFEVAIAVAEQAVREGSARDGLRIEEVREQAKAKVWVPRYPEYVYDEAGLKD